MVVKISKNEEITLGGVFQFDYKEFYNAFHKAVSNSDDYDYTYRGCKQYTVGDSRKSIGIVPIAESHRYSNRDNLSDNMPNMHNYLALQVHDDSKEKIVTNRDIFYIVSSSEAIDSESLIGGELIEYPEFWEKNEDSLILNEAFEVKIDVLREGLEAILSRCDDNPNGYRLEGSKHIEYSASFSMECCHCADENAVIRLADVATSNHHIPRSFICLECLFDFMCEYLNYEKGKANRILVSSDI
mgnify:CR=1 FL=1